MKKNDWIGLGTSVGLHGILLLIFALVAGASPELDTLGYIEVEFGPFAEGRAVQRAVEERTQPEEDPSDREPQPVPTSSPPRDARPVDLPDQVEAVEDEEVVETSESDLIAPEEPINPDNRMEDETNVEATPQSPPGDGAIDGDVGEETGDQGDGTDELESAPYRIEGLNRNLTTGPNPPYTEQVDADIRVRITVNPQGRIVQIFPLVKGDPSLERSIMRTLTQSWRFEPLPANVPQENQSGTVSFRFRRE